MAPPPQLPSVWILHLVLLALAAFVSLGKCGPPLLAALLEETLPLRPQKRLASSLALVYLLSSAETLLYAWYFLCTVRIILVHSAGRKARKVFS